MGIPIDRVDFEAPLPPPDTSYVRIVTPLVGVPCRMLIVGRIAVSVLTHWLPDDKMKGGGRTVPHQVPDDTCPHCVERNQKPRYHAYLACWWRDTGRFYLADLSMSAIHSCPNLDPESGFNLRGLTLIMRRSGVSRNSPVVADLDGPRIGDAVCKPDFEVVPVLRRLWGLSPGERWRTSAGER